MTDQRQAPPTKKPPESERHQNIGEVVNGFSEMEARQMTIHQWTVTSWRNDTQTVHKVNLHEQTCTCEDMEYNSEGSECCDHILVANHYASRQMDVDTALMFDLQERINSLDRSADKLERAATGQVADTVAGYEETQSEMENGDTPNAEPEATDQTTSVDAQEAADRLQTAFDDVLDDMQVETGGGAVFFQTGRDTSDSWPFPGGSETFKVLTEPDMVMYVHDGTADWADSPHRLYDSKPGEWYKNALDPEDVDGYIDEVLQ